MGNQQPVNGATGMPSGSDNHPDRSLPGYGNAYNLPGSVPPSAYGAPAPPGHSLSAPAVQQHQQQQQQQQHAYLQQQQQQQKMQAAAAAAAAAAMQRSSSDASMTIMDDHGIAMATAATQSTAALGPAVETWLDDNTVPTVFRWEHGGRQVYITGTFNGWSRQIPMHRSGNDFTYIHNLKRGKHAFKFIVDDEWRFAPDQPTVADIEGRINNFIDVTDFKPYTGDKDFEREKAAAEYGGVHEDAEESGAPGTEDDRLAGSGSAGGGSHKPDKDGEVFSHVQPDVDDYTKEPPPLPPHLRHIILNKPPQLHDTAALPVPQHVALNHLYCTAIRDNMMVLGITQRYKTKFVTTVYYSPCSSK
jgi:5'-AMP-activated protein kinase, regulatory beta subunit